MRKVVDSNYLQDPLLVRYLQQSRSNYVVLTDYVAMEAYKGNALKGIFKSMGLLCGYSNQIVVLKSTTVVVGLKSHQKGLLKRLIDQDQSKDFPVFCRMLEKARNGDSSLEKQVLGMGDDANDHMRKVLIDAEGVLVAILEIAEQYGTEEMRIIRKRETYTSSVIEKMLTHILEITRLLFSSHPSVKSAPTRKELPYTFIFRYSLCMYLIAIKWLANGGTKGVKPEKMRNDMVDMNIVAYATYFDGLLSKDAKALLVYGEASFLIKKVFCA